MRAGAPRHGGASRLAEKEARHRLGPVPCMLRASHGAWHAWRAWAAAAHFARCPPSDRQRACAMPGMHVSDRCAAAQPPAWGAWKPRRPAPADLSPACLVGGGSTTRSAHPGGRGPWPRAKPAPRRGAYPTAAARNRCLQRGWGWGVKGLSCTRELGPLTGAAKLLCARVHRGKSSRRWRRAGGGS